MTLAESQLALAAPSLRVEERDAVEILRRRLRPPGPRSLSRVSKGTRWVGSIAPPHAGLDWPNRRRNGRSICIGF